MTVTRLPTTVCPECADPLDAASAAEGDHVPTPGDVSICLNCAWVGIFTDELTLRPSTLAERSERLGPEGDRIIRLILARGRLRP